MRPSRQTASGCVDQTREPEQDGLQPDGCRATCFPTLDQIASKEHHCHTTRLRGKPLHRQVNQTRQRQVDQIPTIIRPTPNHVSITRGASRTSPTRQTHNDQAVPRMAS